MDDAATTTPLRERLARRLGIDASHRDAVVAAMLDRHARDAPTYWLHLLLATGIATLGLVLNSTAVVIGAMLISPLMGPIVELGMGLVAGSAYLVLRSAARVTGSLAAAVLGAAVITVALPFHEVTAEIAARTAPTILDLLVAALCALTAASTTMRRGSNGTAEAAGTAIGIALLPPLCVAGFGLGTGALHVATGASLLFVANLSAIVLVASLAFAAVGFEATPIRRLEDEALSGERAERRAERFAEALRRLFGARYGVVLRLAMPLVLVGVVLAPLRRALREVAWQVRVRGTISTILREEAVARNAVRSFVAVEHHSVDVRLVIVARPDEAIALERDLAARIARVSGVEPSVDVVAVPDFATLRQTVSTAAAPSAPRPPELDDVHARVARGLADLWPTASAGPVLAWSIAFPPTGSARLDVTHAGPPLDTAAASLLGRALRRERGVALTVSASSVPMDAEVADPAEGARWLPRLARAVATAEGHRALSLCVRVPSDEALAAVPGGPALLDAARREVGRLAAGRASVAVEDRWSAQFSLSPCPVDAAVVPGDASTSGDGGA